MHLTRRLIVLVAVLAMSPFAARADVDVELDAKAKVSSELAEGETEVYRFRGTANALVSFQLVGKKGAKIDFDVEIRRGAGPGGEEVRLAEPATVKQNAKKLQVKGLLLPATSDYRLIVRSNGGAGAYAMRFGVQPAKEVVSALNLGPAETDVLSFAAPTGSTVTFSVRSPPTSDTDARFGDFEGIDLSGEGTVKKGTHTVKAVVPPPGGSVGVAVTNLGSETGSVSLRLKIKAPKTKTQKLDLRPSALGSPADGESILARTIDAADGGIVAVTDGGPIDGASVDIPPGALPISTRITVATTDSPPAPDGEKGAGEPVALGPEGTTFDQPIQVTLPFDPSLLSANTDPENDLQVLKVSVASGVEILPTSSVDAIGNTVTVQTDSFSTFLVIGPDGIPRLDGAEFWSVFIEFELLRDLGGTDDSRMRAIDFGYGSGAFNGAENAPGGFTFDTIDSLIEWTHDDTGDATVTGTTGPAVDSGAWTYGADGQSVEIRFPGDDPGSPDVFEISRDGRFLAAPLEVGGSPTDTNLDLLVRKPDQPLSQEELAGTYWFGGISGGVFDESNGGPVCIEYEYGFGTLTLTADGGARVDTTQFFTDFAGAGGTQESLRERIRETGTWSVDLQAGPFQGSATAQFTDEEGTSQVRLLPSAGGDVILGIAEGFDPNDAGFNLLVLIRQGSGLKRSAIVGDYTANGVDFGPTTFSVPGLAVVPDFETCQLSGVFRFDGGGAFTEEGDFRLVARNPAVTGGVDSLFETPGEEQLAFSLAKNGRISGGDDEGRFVGAFAPDLQFGFATDDPAEGDTFAALTIFFSQPPDSGD